MLIQKSISQRIPRQPMANAAATPSKASQVLLPAVAGLAVALPAAMWGASLGNEIQGQLYSKGFGLVRDGTINLRQAFDLLPYVRDRALVSQTAATTLGLVGFVAGAALIWYAERQK